MPISVCPIATVHAPLERTWAVLTDFSGNGAWWDARTERIDPPGPLAPGQTIYATAGALGLRLPVTTHVLAIDPTHHVLDLRTTFPFGITVASHVLCQPLDARTCRISFG